MVTWHAAKRVTEEGIANDEAEFALKLLPLRCSLDQRAIRFARAFFQSDDGENGSLPAGLHPVPPPLFTSFRVRPFKLKVDYKPEMIDTKALYDGAFVELINLSPLDGLLLTLQEVVIENEIGVGPVIVILLRQWVRDICATQLLKFLINSRPLEPITNIGGGAVDLVVLPWEAFQNGDSIQRALRAGASSFVRAVAYEAFTTTSRMTEYVADAVSRASSPHHSMDRMLPSRPIRIPRTMTEASSHAAESLSRGLQTASYKIVIVPYREYHRSGATGAVRSVLRGIPVAIAAPASGAAEALSFTLLGARNQMRPDIRKEDEESLRGLHHLDT
jgi:autophagy-related protein 2